MMAIRVGAVALCLAASGGRAQAQTSRNSAAAQELFDQAKTLMTSGRAAEACPKLEESQRLDPASGTLVNLARCYEATGRLASAWSTFIEGATAAKASGNADRERGAREAAAALAPRIAKLRVNVAPDARVPGLEIKKDGFAVGQPQWGLSIPEDPGEHSVVARAPRHREWKTVAIVKGEGTTTDIAVPKLEEAAGEQPMSAGADATADTGVPSGLGTQRIVAIAAGGVGVVGLAVGTIFGLKTMSKKNTADDYCSGSECNDPRGVDAGKEAHSAGNVATVGMIVGAVGVAAGLTLWFTAPSQGPEARVSVGPGSLRLEGTF
jgi:hypothetical protein